ncbi:MAG TPA: hypothetical protein VKS81_04065 [Bacteroidota bacterium]|nr:hypothetical protein [Bacteroidota bacterium]
MKYFSLLLVGVLCVLAIVASPTKTFARGTPAGTVITNTAVMNYKDLAGTSFTADTATVSLTVAQLAGVDVSPHSAHQVQGDSVYVYYPKVVTNTGNGLDAFNLTDVSSQGWTAQLYFDANRNGVLDPSELSAGPITATTSLAEDSSEWIISRVFVPAGTPSNTLDVDSIKAVSQFGLITPPGSSAYEIDSTTVQKAIFSMTKFQNHASLQPDQVVTYTVSYTDSGNGVALHDTITDVVDIDLTVNGGTITGGGFYNSVTRTITWVVPRIASGASNSFQYAATVNHGVVAGTIIPNFAVLQFYDSTDGHTKHTPTDTTSLLVTQYTALYAVIGRITNPTPTGRVADPNFPNDTVHATTRDTIDAGLIESYEIWVYNNGNAVDSASEGFTTTFPLSWKIYVDVNGNGVIDAGDTLANASDLGPMAANGGLKKYIAIDTIPHSAPDTSKDTLKVTFTDLSNSATTATVEGDTRLRAPVLTIHKVYAVVGGAIGLRGVPGDTVLYTITYANHGTGSASTIVITDPSPLNTTYVDGSVIWNNVAQTDIADGDATTVSGGFVTVNIGTLLTGGSGTIKFKVIIN